MLTVGIFDRSGGLGTKMVSVLPLMVTTRLLTHLQSMTGLRPNNGANFLALLVVISLGGTVLLSLKDGRANTGARLLTAEFALILGGITDP